MRRSAYCPLREKISQDEIAVAANSSAASAKPFGIDAARRVRTASPSASRLSRRTQRHRRSLQRGVHSVGASIRLQGIPRNGRGRRSKGARNCCGDENFVKRIAYFFLGSACEYGIGTPLDLQEAAKWYGMAAAAGDKISERELSRLLPEITGKQ